MEKFQRPNFANLLELIGKLIQIGFRGSSRLLVDEHIRNYYKTLNLNMVLLCVPKETLCIGDNCKNKAEIFIDFRYLCFDCFKKYLDK